MDNKSGFTLIELLLVLAIIGIISAIAIPALLSQRARARDKATIANMSNTIGDLVGAYDQARETNLDAVVLMTNVLTAANGNAKNPWDTAGAAYTATLVMAATLGQVGFVYVAPGANPPGSLTGNAIIKNQVAGAVGTSPGPYSASKVCSLE